MCGKMLITTLITNWGRIILLLSITHSFATWMLTKEGHLYWQVLHLLWVIKLYQLNQISDKTFFENWYTYEILSKPRNEYQQHLMTEIKKIVNFVKWNSTD